MLKTTKYSCRHCDWYVVLTQGTFNLMSVHACDSCGKRGVRSDDASLFEACSPVEGVRGAFYELRRLLVG